MHFFGSTPDILTVICGRVVLGNSHLIKNVSQAGSDVVIWESCCYFVCSSDPASALSLGSRMPRSALVLRLLGFDQWGPLTGGQRAGRRCSQNMLSPASLCGISLGWLWPYTEDIASLQGHCVPTLFFHVPITTPSLPSLGPGVVALAGE